MKAPQVQGSAAAPPLAVVAAALKELEEEADTLDRGFRTAVAATRDAAAAVP